MLRTASGVESTIIRRVTYSYIHRVHNEFLLKSIVFTVC